jgi:chemotaxis signal transduction protein
VTAVFVPEKPSRFTRTDVPDQPPVRRTGAEPTTAEAPPARVRRSSTFAAAGPAVPPEPEPAPTVEGYVLFAVGATTFAVTVGEVREIVRAARLELLPLSHVAYGHGVALVDVRGRSIPVVDLRTDRTENGDVLLPMWRHQVGLVVDHVVAVHATRDLVREHEDVPDALPSYSRGVLRPVEGGAPVLLIAMPDAAELEADAVRDGEARLGLDVLADLEPVVVEAMTESG